MKNKILKIIISVLTVGFALGGWVAVDRAINVPEASTWLAPIIWFSLFFIITGLNIALIKNKIIIYPVLFLAILMSLIFSLNVWHFLVIIFGYLLLLASQLRVSGDIDYGKKIKLSRSLRFGKTYIYLALALAISSQYYFSIKDQPVQKFIPDIEIGGVTDYLTPKILSAISPNFAASIGDETTVDQFILQTQADQLDKAGYSPEKIAELPPDQRALIQQQIDQELENNREMLFEEGRKNFSDMVGRPVEGTEKVSDIFSQVINNKINDYFKPGNLENDSLPVAPIATLVLFLTVASLGSFLGFFLVPITAGIFRLLVKLKVVTILKVTVEAEVVDC